MKALAIVLALLSFPAWTHEVSLAEGQQAAAVLTLTYANGEPFAFEAYELYLPGKATPEQVGRTNSQGQIVFLAGDVREWRVKAFSGDGHGIDRVLALTAPAPGNAVAPAPVLPRWMLLLTGLATVFGVFGLVQLFIRKKSS